MKRRDVLKGVAAVTVGVLGFLGLGGEATAVGQPELMTKPTGLRPEAMAAFFGETECKDKRVERLWVNPLDYWQIPKNFRDRGLYDEFHDRRLLRMGIMGFLWGAEVRTSRKIPEGHILLVGTREPHPGTEWDFVPSNPGWVPSREQLKRF